MKFVKPGSFQTILTNFVFLATLIDELNQTDVFKPPLMYYNLLGNEFCQFGLSPNNTKLVKRGTQTKRNSWLLGQIILNCIKEGQSGLTKFVI